MANFRKNILFLILMFLAFLPGSLQATEVALQLLPKNSELTKIVLTLDTKNEIINTLAGEITYDQTKLKLKNVSDANSLVNFWLERPQVDQGRIIFSGIIPSGYRGRGIILTLDFVGDYSDQLLTDGVKIKKINAWLNDGLGQETKVAVRGLLIKQTVEDWLAPSEVKPTSVPESFVPQIIKDRSLPTTDYYLVFGTQDKTSGLAYYGVYETRWPINIVKHNQDLDWVKTESPFLLKDQRLLSSIFVKAVNQNGGVRIVKLSPQFSLSWWYKHWLISFIIIVIVAVFCRSIRLLLKKK